MIKLTSQPEEWNPENVPGTPLFSVDDQEYNLPDTIPAGLALEAAERTATMGGPAAEAWLLERVLGRKAYRALKGAVQDPADLRAIGEVVRVRVFGDLEEEGKG